MPIRDYIISDCLHPTFGIYFGADLQTFHFQFVNFVFKSKKSFANY